MSNVQTFGTVFTYIEEDTKLTIIFNENVNDIEGFEKFCDLWLTMYHRKKNFSFYIDTSAISYINPEFALKTRSFIKYLKERDEDMQFLKKSIIIISSDLVRNVFKIIFSIQRPVAPVYLVKDAQTATGIYNYLEDDTKKLTSEEMKALNISLVMP